MSLRLVISCEHITNDVPSEMLHFFAKDKAVLKTHRAYDIGSEVLYASLAPQAHFVHHADRSRLLIELNRSIGHKHLFSEFIKRASDQERQSLLTYYQEYRATVKNGISELIAAGHQVIHIGVHTFTPMLSGETRNADIGLLYDPARQTEKNFSVVWKQAMKQLNTGLSIRFNYPYLGKADGFTTSLRKEFPSSQYAGVELEVNQKFFVKEDNPQIISLIEASLMNVLRTRASL